MLTPQFSKPDTEKIAERLQPSWGFLVVMGLVLIVVGFTAMAAPVLATFTTVRLFSILLIVGGVVELVSLVGVNKWGAFFHHVITGVLYLFVGAIMFERPGLGAAGYTLLLALFLVATGVARVAYALGHRFPGRTWTITSGVISLLLGVMIWRNLPEAALWVIGTFLGIELVFNGMTWLMLGLAAKKFPRPAAQQTTNS